MDAFEKNELNVTIEQWVILQRIFLLGDDATQAEIVRSNYRNRASTSRVISGLCDKGLVVKKRKEHYTNRFALILTERGKALIERALPVVQELRSIANEDISDEEFQTFLTVLNKLWENYNNYSQ